jgi:circadian clock protein KaiC
LRVVKYRGSAHGTNEYPFLMDDQGITVVPLSSAGLAHRVSDEVVSTGVPGLDAMRGPRGIYRGSSVLGSGVSGAGKTILGASFAAAACGRGERCMFFSFEESVDQLVRTVGSAGIQLRPHVETGLLRVETKRPSSFGFEMHLALMQRELDRFQPSSVIVDPVTSFRGPDSDVHALLLRMLDMLKTRGITTIFTSLTSSNDRVTQSDFGLSSLMDTWIFLLDIERNGERNRGLYVLKSRGMSHSNQIREYLVTDKGVALVEAYLGVDGVLTGSARLSKEAQDRVEAQQQREEVARRRREIANRRAAAERQITELQAEIDAHEAEARRLAAQDEQRETLLEADRAAMGASRGVHANGEDKTQPPRQKLHDTRASAARDARANAQGAR